MISDEAIAFFGSETAVLDAFFAGEVLPGIAKYAHQFFIVLSHPKTALLGLFMLAMAKNSKMLRRLKRLNHSLPRSSMLLCLNYVTLQLLGPIGRQS